ncbi:hypothetical protein Ancab_014680 [Ancistrocladus abbreviatus]
MRAIRAAGFIMTMDPDLGSEQVKGTTVTLGVPTIILNNMQASTVWLAHSVYGQFITAFMQKTILRGKEGGVAVIVDKQHSYDGNKEQSFAEEVAHLINDAKPNQAIH